MTSYLQLSSATKDKSGELFHRLVFLPNYPLDLSTKARQQFISPLDLDTGMVT